MSFKKITSYLVQFIFQSPTKHLTTMMIAAVLLANAVLVPSDSPYWIIVPTAIFDYLLNALLILQMFDVRPL